MLMENAARGICQLITNDFSDAECIMIACGFGNNGGDGLALTRLLAAEGVLAKTYLIDSGRPLTQDAAANQKLLANCGLPLFHDSNGQKFRADIETLGPNSLIVDCLLGTGIQGDPRDPYADVIESINHSQAKVLAIDVPSGLNAETGIAGSPTVIANQTITFVGMKVGFQNVEASIHTGQISVAPIGLPLGWVLNFLKQHRRDQTSC